MAIVNFLFGNRSPGGFSIDGAVAFDAQLTISESHSRNATVTQHPVEDGSVITDHVIRDAETVQLEGFVTDAAVRGAQRDATQEAFDKLDAAWRSGQLMQVITARKTYVDMILVQLSLPRERPSSMTFTMQLQQVRLVTPEVVEGVLSADQVLAEDRDLVQPEVEQGAARAERVQPQERAQPVEEQANNYSSFAGSLVGGSS